MPGDHDDGKGDEGQQAERPGQGLANAEEGTRVLHVVKHEQASHEMHRAPARKMRAGDPLGRLVAADGAKDDEHDDERPQAPAAHDLILPRGGENE